jgi:SAM-dependent methyltransferase
LLPRIRRRLARLLHPVSPGAPARDDYEGRIAYLEEVVRHLDFQVAGQASLLRHLAGPHMQDLPEVRATRASFDFQWAELPKGRYMLENEQFRAEAPGYVQEFTGLPADWFRGKSVLDAGCGLGRYSWALCQLGARVTSIDQSASGLQRTAEACRDYPGHRTVQVDLLQPLPLDESFDLVWSFGVLHHTGDTYRAFTHVAQWVKPDGYLYVMVYGKPREGHRDDYAEINEYDEWRQRTRNLALRDKLTAVRAHMRDGGFRVAGEEHVHGYFDAIAPPINDLYTFPEVEAWFQEAGFTSIRQTVNTRNLHIIGRRTGGAASADLG